MKKPPRESSMERMLSEDQGGWLEMWMELQSRVACRLHAIAGRRRIAGGVPKHLITGERGELEALFYLRGVGYRVVARRWTTLRLRGDLDLVGWDGESLCFVEVKSRSSRDRFDALAAVDEDKRETLRRMARAYLRGFPAALREDIPVRFDVVSVYFLSAGTEFELYRGAFGW